MGYTLLGMYVANEGPLKDRYLCFDTRYRLEVTGHQVSFHVDRRQEHPVSMKYWSAAFKAFADCKGVSNVNLVIGPNGSGKTSFIFLLQSMLWQLKIRAPWRAADEFSGFSLWEDNGSDEKSRFVLYYTGSKPYKTEQETISVISVDSLRNGHMDDLPIEALPQLILVSNALENRFFPPYFNQVENPGYNSNWAGAAFSEYTPQFIIKEMSAFLSRTLSPRIGRRNVGIEDWESEWKISWERVRLHEAYFATLLQYLVKACTNVIWQEYIDELAKNTEETKEGGNRFKGSVRLSLVSQSSSAEAFAKQVSTKDSSETEPIKISFFEKEMGYCLESIRTLLESQEYEDIRYKIDEIRFFYELPASKSLPVLKSEREYVSLITKARIKLENLRKPELIPRVNRLDDALEEFQTFLQMKSCFDWHDSEDGSKATLTLQNIARAIDKHGEGVILPLLESYCCYTILPSKDAAAGQDIRVDTLSNSRLDPIVRFFQYVDMRVDTPQNNRSFNRKTWSVPSLRLEGSSGQINQLLLAKYLLLETQNRQDFSDQYLNRPCILLLDEADLSYHPEWQRTLMSNLLKLLERLKVRNWHVILATHSPILLSDFPKENIIQFGDEKAAYETFAQNIYRLYQDRMHLSSAVGELAEEYLKQIGEEIEDIRRLESGWREKYLETSRRIQLIGDPMLKGVYMKELEGAVKEQKKKDNADVKMKLEVLLESGGSASETADEIIRLFKTM